MPPSVATTAPLSVAKDTTEAPEAPDTWQAQKVTPMPALSQRQRAVIAYEQSYGREPSAGWTAQPRQHDRQIALRLAKLEASCERLKPYLESQQRAEKRKRHDALNARARKLLSKPERRIEPSWDPLDQQIELQLSCQHAQYHGRLRQLYSAAVTYNELYFAGKLPLSILTVESLQNAQATYRGKGRESVIAFDPKTMTRPMRDCEDVLLHELVHCALEVFTPGGDKYLANAGGWHHSRFVAVANQIAKQRGWPDCSECITAGAKAAQFWPPRTHH